MTDKEKLQKLFDAALKEPVSSGAAALKRAVPESPLSVAPPVTAFPQVAPSPAVTEAAPQPVVVEAPAPAVAEGPVLDDAASTELGILLDEQIQRQKRKRRRESMIAATVLLGITGGGSAWFVQSPARVQAFKEALRDIRSVGDVKSMVAKYQKALDRIAVRSGQIDQAAAAMGVKKSAKDDEDPYMDAEMKQMMGSEGKTVGQRNKMLQTSFGKMQEKNGGPIKAKVAMNDDNSFQWQK